ILDSDELFAKVTAIAVPAIADWCVLDIADDGVFRSVAWAHVDADRVSEVKALHRHYPIDANSAQPQGQVLRSGESLLVTKGTAEMTLLAARDEEHLRRLQALDPRSWMACPLVSGGRTIGVAMFVSSQSDRSFDAFDLSLAEELLRRLGMALE